MMLDKYTINDLSEYLFWDMDKSAVNFVKSKNSIIYKVVEFGTTKDWNIIKAVYGLEEIKKVALTFRSLDPVTLAFLSNYFNLNKTDFRCYTNKLSAQNFWNS
jgi:hypothetical protein